MPAILERRDRENESSAAETRAREARLHDTQLRQGMRVGIIDGIFASASDNLAGPYLSLYALLLGATHTQIGLVTAIPALIGTLCQLPGAWLTERLQKRKMLTIIGGVGARAAWLPVAFIPFFHLSPGTAVALFVTLLALRAGFGALSSPAWTSLIADVTPQQMRGRYFANRTMLLTVAGLGATFASGMILKLFPDPFGYQVIFGLACIFGLAASYSFSRFPDLDADAKTKGENKKKEEKSPAPPTDVPRLRLMKALVQGIRDVVVKERAFTAFAGMALVWNLGVHLPSPLFAINFVESLGGSAGFWGVVTGSTFVTTILGQRYWGPLTDRFGGRNVMVASGVIAAMIPVLWLGAFRPEHGIVINLISGFGWAGYNLAAFNLLLEVTPDARRTVYVAGYNSLIGISQFVGPTLGGILADLVGIKSVFVLATGLRFLGWGLLIRRVHTTLDKHFHWRDYVRLPRGGIGGIWALLRGLPAAVVRRWRVRRAEAELRQKMQARLRRYRGS